VTISFTSMTAAQDLDHMRSDAYFAERVAGADELQATAYRRAREHLKPYPSAIIFPEALLFLPVHDLRRQVWAVDFEVVRDKDGAPAVVGSKVRRIEFLDLTDEHHLAIVYETEEEVVEADLAGSDFGLCRRLPWLDNAYDPVARLRLYLPAAGQSGQSAFELDVLFANGIDALRYQSTMSRLLWLESC
jgi:hypothetical protein